MKPVRVLVVDDSEFIRSAIIALLSTDKEIRVVGEAGNGFEALEMIRETEPDLVTMDIVMPVMDGLEAIERIMGAHALPILVLTSKGDAHTAYTAISKGALEVLPKPELDLENSKKFIDKIKLLSRVKVIAHIRNRRFPGKGLSDVPRESTGKRRLKKVIAVAASTGGPNAFSVLLPQLPENLPYPIVVAQHIQDSFIGGMVTWLDSVAGLKVKLAEKREEIRPGYVYFSPAGSHMEIDGQNRVVFVNRGPDDIHFPSCDRLLSSVAKSHGPGSIGIILSGMGSDGVKGMIRIKEAGGVTIAQDETSSIIFGMPKEAINKGCIDNVLHLDKIAPVIRKLARLPGPLETNPPGPGKIRM